MKKILCVLVMLLTLCACSNNSNVKNPIVEYNSLDEINEIAKTTLVSPGVMGKSNERYSVIDKKIAEYSFALNGYEYTLRGASFTDEDISGIYIDGEQAFTSLNEILDYNSDSTCKAFRFLLGDNQYTLVVEDNSELDYATFFSQFSNIYLEIINASTSDEVKQFLGQYYDSTSKRATAEITLADVDKLFIDVTWSNSATEYEEWIINGEVKDKKISYETISHYTVAVEEDGTTTPNEIKDYAPGYFEIKENKLYWTGSGNTQTSSCVFEKAE